MVTQGLKEESLFGRESTINDRKVEQPKRVLQPSLSGKIDVGSGIYKCYCSDLVS